MLSSKKRGDGNKDGLEETLQDVNHLVAHLHHVSKEISTLNSKRRATKKYNHSSGKILFFLILENNCAILTLQRVDGKRVPLKWDKIKGPYQPGGTECGYYTMKFMREIVEACSTGSFENKMTNLELKETYTQDELDGVQLDIIQFIQENGVFQPEANEDEF